jgi:hypothetical protein
LPSASADGAAASAITGTTSKASAAASHILAAQATLWAACRKHIRNFRYMTITS